MSKDKHGHDYRELRQIQQAHLNAWAQRLIPPISAAICDYVEATNRQANDDTTAHRVYRGQDLVQIVLDWPELKDCYPKPATAEVAPSDLV